MIKNLLEYLCGVNVEEEKEFLVGQKIGSVDIIIKEVYREDGYVEYTVGFSNEAGGYLDLDNTYGYEEEELFELIAYLDPKERAKQLKRQMAEIKKQLAQLE